MEQRKITYTFLILIFSFAAKAQPEKQQFVHSGILRTTLTISPATSGSIYLQGNVEYYLHPSLSVRGDGFYGVKYGQDFLTQNHSIFSGASYHFTTKGNFDPYFFFQPGVAITQKEFQSCINVYPTSPECVDSKIITNPLTSIGSGFNYYFQKWAHLFGELRYVYGKHIPSTPPAISLSELRFSFGLGFNFNFKK
jgi:hypothetical protein